MSTVFAIFYMDKDSGDPFVLGSDDIVVALKVAENVRKQGHLFVTIASENTDRVGGVGVAGVVDGKLPDGTDYDWTKHNRVGGAAERFKEPKVINKT